MRGKKRRTRGHVIADLAVNHVERHVLLAGFTIHRMTNDYGLDEIIRTFNRRGEVEKGLIWLQIKATDHIQVVRERDALAVRVERRDLVHWITEQYPVILVLYDARRDRAYWLHVQQALAGGKVFELAKSGATLTIQVPLEQVIHEKAIGVFRQFKVEAETMWKKGEKYDD